MSGKSSHESSEVLNSVTGWEQNSNSSNLGQGGNLTEEYDPLGGHTILQVSTANYGCAVKHSILVVLGFYFLLSDCRQRQMCKSESRLVSTSATNMWSQDCCACIALLILSSFSTSHVIVFH